MPKKNSLRHIAFIMDGNGRWAKRRGLGRDEGHKAGGETFRKIVEYCRRNEISILTVYAFSTENWKRPKPEVALLMQLLYKYLEENSDKLMAENIRFRVIGDKSAFADKLRRKMDEVEKMTAENTAMLLNVALNYGGRAEIVYAVNKLMASGKTCVTEKDISDSLYTFDCADPDLIVRTSGELRLSNFLIWQGAYSELYFTDKLWPDIKEEDIDEAIDEYMKRQRRFGGV